MSSRGVKSRWAIELGAFALLLLPLAACTDVATPTPVPTSTVTPMPTPIVTRASTPTPEPVYDVEEARAELAAAKALWEVKGSDHYTIEYGGFPWLLRVPIRLTVRNGVIESATFLEGRDAGMPVPPVAMSSVLTIDGLFDEIERVLGRPAWNMSAEYDAELGYPRDFEVSYTNTPDDYFAASICCYKPLAHPPPTMAPATSTSTPPTANDSMPDYECGPAPWGFDGELHESFVHWAGDGAYLVFDYDDALLVLDIKGAQLREVADADEDYTGNSDDWYRLKYGFYADVSPDGSRIIYSTCEYYLDDAKDAWGVRPAGYDIATVNIDGTDRKRLTRDRYLDHFPAWSPNGTRIAIVRDKSIFAPWGTGYDGSLYIVYADTQGRIALGLVASVNTAAKYPPVWSPDGQRLAFIAYEEDGSRILYTVAVPTWSPDSEDLAFTSLGEEPRIVHDCWRPNSYVSDCVWLRNYWRNGIHYSVRSDAPKLHAIGETVALPTWSPDGEELAFASVDGESQIIYAVKPDGTDLRTIWRRESDKAAAPIFQVLWSPDGSELLFLSDEAYLVRQDGSDLRLLPAAGTRTAWSPDGSRIAIYEPGYTLYTMSRDGTDLRVLVEKDADGNLVPVSHTE